MFVPKIGNQSVGTIPEISIVVPTTFINALDSSSMRVIFSHLPYPTQPARVCKAFKFYAQDVCARRLLEFEKETKLLSTLGVTCPDNIHTADEASTLLSSVIKLIETLKKCHAKAPYYLSRADTMRVLNDPMKLSDFLISAQKDSLERARNFLQIETESHLLSFFGVHCPQKIATVIDAFNCEVSVIELRDKILSCPQLAHAYGRYESYIDFKGFLQKVYDYIANHRLEFHGYFIEESAVRRLESGEQYVCYSYRF
jgi:hypothetical protein